MDSDKQTVEVMIEFQLQVSARIMVTCVSYWNYNKCN